MTYLSVLMKANGIPKLPQVNWQPTGFVMYALLGEKKHR